MGVAPMNYCTNHSFNYSLCNIHYTAQGMFNGFSTTSRFTSGCKKNVIYLK